MKITVQNQTIKVTSADILVSGTVNVYEVEFTFDAAWEGYTLMAVFEGRSSGKTVNREVVINGGKAVIPWETLLANGYLRIGVYGLKENQRLPTIYTERLPVQRGAEAADPAAEPTLGVIDQILIQTAADREAAEQAKEDAAASALSASRDSGAAADARTQAQTYRDDAALYANQVQSSINLAAGFAQSSQENANKSFNAAMSAEKSKNAAALSEQAAAAAADNALISEKNAQIHASAATGFASQANTAAAEAQDSANAAELAKEGAETAAENASDAVYAAVKAKEEAESSKTAAAGSAENAQNSANAAENAKNAAENAQQGAETAKTAAQEAAGAAQQSAAAANASAQQAAESAETLSGTIDDVTQLKSDIVNKADKTDLAVTNRSLDALWKLNQGISYEFQTDDAEAYSKTVPSGAKLASVEAVGGKTVVWNQMINGLRNVQLGKTGVVCDYINNLFILNGNATSGGGRTSSIAKTVSLKNGHRYYYDTFRAVYFSKVAESSNYIIAKGKNILKYTGETESYIVGISVSSGDTYDNVVGRISVVDLTQLFGAGNEPTTTDDPRIAWIEQYAEVHPEYNAGELMSADVESVIVHGNNLFNINAITSNDCVTQHGSNYTTGFSGTAMAINNGTLQLKRDTKDHAFYICLGRCYKDKTIYVSFKHDGGIYDIDLRRNAPTTPITADDRFFRYMVSDNNVSHVIVPDEDGYIYIEFYSTNQVFNCNVSDILVSNTFATYSTYFENTYPIPAAVRALPGYGWSAGDVYNSIERTETGWQYVQRVGSRDYQDGDTVTDGTTTYYELDTPNTIDITDLITDALDAITVESGGSITFENAVKLPIPNSVEYAVKLSEVNQL